MAVCSVPVQHRGNQIGQRPLARSSGEKRQNGQQCRLLEQQNDGCLSIQDHLYCAQNLIYIYFEEVQHMTKVTDFTHDEGELLFAVPFVVAGTSLAVIHVSALKAVKTALSLYLIVRDTSRQFPESECIQSIFALKEENHEGQNELIEKHEGSSKEDAIAIRNQMCEQAIGILNKKGQPQEVEAYKRWLLQIASEVMHKAHSTGFLGLGKAHAEAEIAQALQDFTAVLQFTQ